MQFARLARHRNDHGSAVTGFALVTPLLILVFVGIIAICAVLGQRLILGAAASSGARMAATLGATRGQAMQQIDQVLVSFSMSPASVSRSLWSGKSSGAPAVFIRLSKRVSIPVVNRQFEISSTSHRIDENQ